MKRSHALRLSEIRQYFNLPETEAAKKLNVGVTLLKRRCRELYIKRWPQRKINSLESLIDNLKGMGLRTEAIEVEEEKRLVEKMPNMELTDRTKKLWRFVFEKKIMLKLTL